MRIKKATRTLRKQLAHQCSLGEIKVSVHTQSNIMGIWEESVYNLMGGTVMAKEVGLFVFFFVGGGLGGGEKNAGLQGSTLSQCRLILVVCLKGLFGSRYSSTKDSFTGHLGLYCMTLAVSSCV